MPNKAKSVHKSKGLVCDLSGLGVKLLQKRGAQIVTLAAIRMYKVCPSNFGQILSKPLKSI